jgi:DNA-binding protein H-NS
LKKFKNPLSTEKHYLRKNPDELFALVIKQRTEAALEFQRSVEQSLEQLSNISSEFEPSSQLRRKWPYKSVLRFSFEMVQIDCSNANIYYIINMLVCFKSIIRQYCTPFQSPILNTGWHSMSEALKVLNNIRTLRAQARETDLETLEEMLEKLTAIVEDRREEESAIRKEQNNVRLSLKPSARNC